MTMTDSPLFYADGLTEGTTQWKAESFQMVNWGGFQGHHEVVFAPSSTLVSGASGTGKSSLLDAYLALMMPSDTPFNGASNDAGSGRARSVDQRNLMTYLKGKTDSNREAGTGQMRDQVLRGVNASTWGAVSMTFVDDNQRRFTVLRAYFVPRGGSKFADITMKMATRDGYLDLRDLAEATESRFDKRALKARFPDLDVFDTYAAFAQTLYTRLGIGANGEGGKALRLLARIQAGQQVKTVDGLYKSMVLEEPATFAAADKAVDHFEDLERSYGAMVTEAQKARVLERLPDLHRDYETATEKADLIDTFGVHRSGDTPFGLWQLQAERRLLEGAADANREQRRGNQAESTEARDAESELKTRVADLQDRQRENGGEVLVRLQNELGQLSNKRNDVAGVRAKFDERIRPLSASIGSPEEFGAAQGAAEAFLAGFPRAEAGLEAERATLHRRSYPVEESIRTLKAEHAFLTGRASLVPQHLHNARLMIAEAAGIPAEEVPFVAELIEIAQGEEQWRQAAEVTLASVVRVMLVDETRLASLSQAIDPLHIPVRIHFEGVALHAHQEMVGDARFVSGKLVYKDSPFSRWVQDRVQASNLDAQCVATPAELVGDGPRVTPSGQTRNGKRGAHGWNSDQKSIIGFSSRARLEEITEELARLKATADASSVEASTLGNRIADLRARKVAHQYVIDIAWPTIDVDGAEARIRDKEAEQERLLANSDVLRGLKDEEIRLSAELERAQKRRHVTDLDAQGLRDEQELIVDRQDAVSGTLDRIDRDQSVTLSKEHSAHLEAQFAFVGDQDDLAAFEGAVKRLRERLTEQFAQDRDNAASARDSLVRIFETFQGRWPDPNIGVSLDSYTSYRDILDAVYTLGLHERRQEWKRRLSLWSGQDLVPLMGAFTTSIEEIEDRLRPINEILATLPFGAGRDRLKIALRRLHRDDATSFRTELKALSSGAAQDLTEGETESRFIRLQAFMGLIRRPESGSRQESQRDLLLDVRKHVEITAVRTTPEGVEASTYSSLGGKSGGESQELVAFVVGAALRFQLGDESRTRPRFAPVFLDEGFVKSDSEFAGRAVAAWKGLGFQLIIGSPLDKVTALEPHMELVLSMTKNNSTGFSYITPLSSPRGQVELRTKHLKTQIEGTFSATQTEGPERGDSRSNSLAPRSMSTGM
ncbi:ATP-binding protein [Cryobacterium sp. Sr8]|uniref:ATP-binding protein n=1 Tax=Cryobacterium sp. Sr8 TaxID=1259203 RepID=UPI00141A91DB|nr:SbcC/MukB-like Walker B domain-containing protein [Cryobacterium sp. Sr8]